MTHYAYVKMSSLKSIRYSSIRLSRSTFVHKPWLRDATAATTTATVTTTITKRNKRQLQQQQELKQTQCYFVVRTGVQVDQPHAQHTRTPCHYYMKHCTLLFYTTLPYTFKSNEKSSTYTNLLYVFIYTSTVMYGKKKNNIASYSTQRRVVAIAIAGIAVVCIKLNPTYTSI